MIVNHLNQLKAYLNTGRSWKKLFVLNTIKKDFLFQILISESCGPFNFKKLKQTRLKKNAI